MLSPHEYLGFVIIEGRALPLQYLTVSPQLTITASKHLCHSFHLRLSGQRLRSITEKFPVIHLKLAGFFKLLFAISVPYILITLRVRSRNVGGRA